MAATAPTTTGLRLTLSSTPATTPAAPTVPPPAPTLTSPAAGDATPSEAVASKPIDSLRLQFKQTGASDVLATEKAIAVAALGLPEQVVPPAPVETMAMAAEAGVTVATHPLPPPAGESPAPAPAPGAVNPLTGLRLPTPELAAAFLASNPTPASAVGAPAIPGSPGQQGNRSPNSGPTVDKPRPALPTRSARAKSANPESILLVIGSILAVLLGGGLTGAYLILRKPVKAPTPVVETEEAPLDPASETPPADTVATSSPTDPAATDVTDPSATTPADSSAASAAGTAPEVDGTAAEAATATTPTVESGPPQPPAPRVNRPDPTVLAWVQKIELTGIRDRGPVPKVFMNGKLFEVGEVVNYQLNLKLVGIVGKVLRFEDAEGNTYEYRF